jgi:stage V sporulation protein R
LASWEKDLLTIVHEEAQYFIPQIETKIMNEGWATFWHKRILDALDLPQDLHLEFLVRHNQLVRPFEKDLNPYHVGLAIWQNLYENSVAIKGDETEDVADGGERDSTGRIFEIRESDRDSSFIRRHLTEALGRRLNLFEFETAEGKRIVSNVSNADGWASVKKTLLRNVGTNAVPVIKVSDADFGQRHCLYLVHYHDGRDLELEYAEKTMAYLNRLWQGEVALETELGKKKMLLIHDDGGFSAKAL